jgi:arylsulfatase A-like enzyme
VIFTSTYASMYGGCLGPLALERPSPIAALADCGYTTAGFTTNPLLSRSYGYHRGFNHFFDLVPAETDPFLRRIKGGENLLRRPITHRLFSLVNKNARPARLYSSAQELTAQANHWLGEVEDPFFVWLHYMDIHWPYHLEENLSHPVEIAQAWKDMAHLHGVNWEGARITPAQKARYKSLYEKALKYLDDQVGVLIRHLDSLGRLDDTAIVLVSDHGEEFLERGRWGHLETNLHDEIIRIPLVIFLPGLAGAQVVQQQVSTLDIMPTILELCGCPSPPGLLGANLTPLWSQREDEYDEKVSISEMWREHWHIIAARTGNHKYIWDSRKPDQPKLYDLINDPGENWDIHAQFPGRVKHFQTIIDQHLKFVAKTAPADPVNEPDLDSQMIRRLRDLGYVE